jgi:hypothetical protein
VGFQSIDCLVALLKDKNFDLLSLKMKEPNLFEALGIVRNEIRHSNFLAWLLDPYQNHGLGDIFIRRFLRDVFSDERVPQRSIIDADIIDLSKIEIRREWCHIDILIIIDNDIIVIENKIDSQDHSNQLMRYKNSVENTFSRKNIYKHYVYLTPLGTTPSEEIAQEFYINYSYSDIVAILSSILDIYEDNINNRARIYIEDYYRMIRPLKYITLIKRH